LAASVSITVPYLAQIVFHKDIEQFTATEATQAIDQARQIVVQKFDSAIARKNEEIAVKRAEYEAEIAGKGLSGLYGEGPVAKAKLSDALRLEGERDSLLAERDRTLAEFNRLSGEWASNREKLAASYNVNLPKASILQNRKALEEMRKRPENRQTELALKAFMWFIFAGLLLLKLFEPRSVRLYMSEVLQQEYLRYKAGTFDEWLPDGEKSTTEFKMSPQRLYAFLVSTWLPIQKTEEEKKEEAKRKQKLEEARQENERRREEERREWALAEEQRKRQEEWDREERERVRAEAHARRQQEMRDRLDAAHERIAAAQKALDHLRSQRAAANEDLQTAYNALKNCRALADVADTSFNDLKSTIDIVQKDIEYFDRELLSSDKQRANLDEKGRTDLAGIQTQIRQKRADANQSLSDLKESFSAVEKKHQDARRDLSDAEERYQKALRRVDELQEKIELLERQVAEETLRTGSSILGTEARTQ
jgi:hypothetical protein